MYYSTATAMVDIILYIRDYNPEHQGRRADQNYAFGAAAEESF